MLGTPFMPWQRHVADVAYELDDRGALVYREVVLTVPRQSGKTTAILAAAVHRCLATPQFGPRNKVLYTAQTRKDAREKFEDDIIEGGLKQSRKLRGRFTVHLVSGSERVRFTNGSRFAIESTTEKTGHGGTLDLGFVDEAFAQPDGRLEGVQAGHDHPPAGPWLRTSTHSGTASGADPGRTTLAAHASLALPQESWSQGSSVEDNPGIVSNTRQAGQELRHRGGYRKCRQATRRLPVPHPKGDPTHADPPSGGRDADLAAGELLDADRLVEATHDRTPGFGRGQP